MFFWNSLAFLMIQQILAIWALIPLPFLKPTWTSGSSQFMYWLKPGLENFEHYLAGMQNEHSCTVVWTFFSIAFFEIFAWGIPWTEKTGRLRSIGLQRVGHDWSTYMHAAPFMYSSMYSCQIFLISSVSSTYSYNLVLILGLLNYKNWSSRKHATAI